jgi:hypothetical protein
LVRAEPGRDHGGVMALGRQLESEQQARLMDLRRWRANYEDQGKAPSSCEAPAREPRAPLYNVTRVCSQTACAKIAKSKPRPQFLTDDGDWEQQQRAEGLTELVAGQFELLRVYDVGDRCFFDCHDRARGRRAHRDRGRQAIRRAHPAARRLLRRGGERVYSGGGRAHALIRRYVDRGVLAVPLPEEEAGDQGCARRRRLEGVSRARAVRSSRCGRRGICRSGEGADDGKHVIAIEGALLLEEDYSSSASRRAHLLGSAGRWVLGRPLAAAGRRATSTRS